ncbi:nuclear prelamin A recognition factor-like, putative [Babesia caballi]|uniref:Nuclear prelamin A recognition factor-like, putative n=1 Tax=Babesia caballi TaxID=5871 RepID=A0AAV4LW45_BABCB|nr:nuclear prelamin A recognition factor-like, putative [Babesia caballi]
MFSSAVKIDELNDYLNLSEECVLPVGKSGEAYEVKQRNQGGKAPNRLEPATTDAETHRIVVGLSDCMTCSGCLTSSEDIILKDRGYDDIARKIGRAEFAAVSIAPQTAFMFAATYDVTYRTAFRKLAYLLRRLGAKRVYTMDVAEAVALHEAKAEFREAISAVLEPGARLRMQKGDPLTADDIDHGLIGTDEGGPESEVDHPSLPIIAGHCPGWTTYAEKNLDASIVSKISKVASSQQIQGALIKTLGVLEHAADHIQGCVDYQDSPFGSRFRALEEILRRAGAHVKYNNLRVTPVYHVATAPCYDKKIEAAHTQADLNLTNIYKRAGAHSDSGDVKLVDDVLSSADLQKIMQQHNLDFRTMPQAELDHVFSGKQAFLFSNLFQQHLPFPCSDGTYLRPGMKNSQSGGFAEEIMRFAAESIFQTGEVPEFTKTINADYQEATLKVGGRSVLTFVLAYGFRNVQNIVQKLKRRSGPGHLGYVEVMACPGGCFNGAGQVLVPPPRSPGYFEALLGRLDRGVAVEPTEKARQLYHSSSKYVDTGERTDVKAITATVIPTFSSLIGADLIAAHVRQRVASAKGSVASLKW